MALPIKHIELQQVVFDGKLHTFQNNPRYGRSYQAERAVCHVLADGRPRVIIVTRDRGIEAHTKGHM